MDFDDAGGEAEGIEEAGESEGKTKIPIKQRKIQPVGKHVTRTHTREKPYSCPHCTSNSPGRKTCNAIFGFKTGDRPYSCPNCFQWFSQLKRMKHHLTIHSGERPYSCPHCHKQYTWAKDMDHIRLHAEERSYSSPLMSRIERKYCSISTSYLVGLSDIFILLHIWQNCVSFGVFSPMRTICDAYHKEFESH